MRRHRRSRGAISGAVSKKDGRRDGGRQESPNAERIQWGQRQAKMAPVIAP
jgi:hypothetical protein